MPGRHCHGRVELYGISLLSFSSLQRRIVTKGKLSPEWKRRCAAAEGTMAVRCRLLLRENYVIPTLSINIRLCRGKMGKECSARASSRPEWPSNNLWCPHQKWRAEILMCQTLRVPGWEWGEMSWYILVLLGWCLDLKKRQLNLVSMPMFHEVWKLWVIPQSTRVSKSRKGHPGALPASLGGGMLTKDCVGWTD